MDSIDSKSTRVTAEDAEARRNQLRNIDRICDRFESQLDHDGGLALCDFLTQEKISDQEIVHELIRVDLERRLENNEQIQEGSYARSLSPYDAMARDVFTALTTDAPLERLALQFGDKTYEIHEQIGAGGMARVYRGFDQRLNRSVAIKKLRKEMIASNEAVNHFKNEAQLMAAIRHDGIVRVLDVGIHEEEVFLVFELIEGGTLGDLIESRSIRPDQAARFAMRIAEAIHEAHRLNIIHHDLKPSNILLTDHGQLKVNDFGLASLSATVNDFCMQPEFAGTISYMAPEQMRGIQHADERVDIYSIGVILFQMLTGKLPFEGSSRLEKIERINKEAASSPRLLNSKVPRDLAAVCLKCLSKDPSDRYDSAKHLAEDLQSFLSCRPVLARPPGVLGRFVKRCQRNLASTAIASVAIVALLVLSVFFVMGLVQERNRFRDQRDQAVENLYDSLVGEARAIRLAGDNGFRGRAWEKIRLAIDLNAANLDRGELRDEVVAGMPDFAGQDPVVWGRPGVDLYTANAVHPTRPLVACGMFSGKVQLRSIPDGTIIANLESHQSGVFEIVFSRDGNMIASADDEGEICIWKEDRDQEWSLILKFHGIPPARRQYVKTYTLAFAENDSTLLSLAFGSVKIESWDLTSEDKTSNSEFTGLSPLVRFSLNSDGTQLAIGNSDNQVLVLDRSTKKIIRSLSLTETPQLLEVQFSPDSRRIAVGTLNDVHLFDLVHRDQTRGMSGDHLITLAFSPDSQTLALPSEDQNLVRLWDVESGQVLAILDNDAYEALYSNDSNWLICISASEITVWNLRSQGGYKRLSRQQHSITDLFFDETTGELYSSSRGDLHVHDVNENQIVLAKENAFRTLAESGEYLFGVDSEFVFVIPKNQDDKNSDIIKVKHHMGNAIADCFLDAELNCFWLAGRNGVQYWRFDVEKSGKVLRMKDSKTLFSGSAGSLAVSENAKYIAWADSSGQVWIWDSIAADFVQTEQLTASIPLGIEFVPGTHKMLCMDVMGKLRQLDLDTGLISTIDTFHSSLKRKNTWELSKIKISPTGDQLCIQRGERIEIWKIGTMKKVVRLPKENGLIRQIAWDSSGNRLAFGMASGEVVVWNLQKVNQDLQSFGLNWK